MARHNKDWSREEHILAFPTWSFSKSAINWNNAAAPWSFESVLIYAHPWLN
jgi:hypothetical protein